VARKLVLDKVLFAALVALAFLGCVMIYSASAFEATRSGASPYRYLLKQLVALCVGFGVAWILSRLDCARLKDPVLIYGAFFGCLLLCVAVLFRPPIHAARRWIVLGPVTVQPAEFLKVALLLLLAYQLDRKRDFLGDFFRGILPVVLLPAIAAAIVLAEPDFGTAMTYLLISAALIFLAGAPLRYFALGAAACLPVFAMLVLSTAYRRDRLLAFLHPDADPLGRGFQAAQSLIAIGAGGIAGSGLGQSRQKLFFLPYPHTDFIFAIVGEELGFLGGIAVVGLFAVVAWRGLRAALRAPEPHAALLAAGATVMIVLQAAINVGVVLTLLPTKGIPLPFLSYGGSSLVADCAAAGILLNVSQHAT
jgi:cell division protein FtsW